MTCVIRRSAKTMECILYISHHGWGRKWPMTNMISCVNIQNVHFNCIQVTRVTSSTHEYVKWFQYLITHDLTEYCFSKLIGCLRNEDPSAFYWRAYPNGTHIHSEREKEGERDSTLPFFTFSWEWVVCGAKSFRCAIHFHWQFQGESVRAKRGRSMK